MVNLIPVSNGEGTAGTQVHSTAPIKLPPVPRAGTSDIADGPVPPATRNREGAAVSPCCEREGVAGCLPVR